MDKLFTRPDQNGYALTQADPLSIQLDGPASYYRADVDKTPYLASLTWTLSAYGYQYMRSFYRLHRGVVPFTLDLAFDYGDLVEYTARFMPGTFQLSGVKKGIFTVSAQLEVAVQTPALDEASMLAVYAAGIQYDLDIFNTIVNVNWPHV